MENRDSGEKGFTCIKHLLEHFSWINAVCRLGTANRKRIHPRPAPLFSLRTQLSRPWRWFRRQRLERLSQWRDLSRDFHPRKGGKLHGSISRQMASQTLNTQRLPTQLSTTAAERGSSCSCPRQTIRCFLDLFGKDTSCQKWGFGDWRNKVQGLPRSNVWFVGSGPLWVPPWYTPDLSRQKAAENFFHKRRTCAEVSLRINNVKFCFFSEAFLCLGGNCQRPFGRFLKLVGPGCQHAEFYPSVSRRGVVSKTLTACSRWEIRRHKGKTKAENTWNNDCQPPRARFLEALRRVWEGSRSHTKMALADLRALTTHSKIVQEIDPSWGWKWRMREVARDNFQLNDRLIGWLIPS